MVISFANAAQNSRAVSREQLLSRSSCGSRVQLKSGLRFLRPFGVFKSDLRMQGRGRCRTGVARGGVHDDARVFVIAHEGRVGDLAGEVVHDGQIFIGGIKLGLEICGHGFSSGARVARLADEQVVGGNRVGQRGQLGGGHAVISEVGKVRVRGGVNRRGNILTFRPERRRIKCSVNTETNILIQRAAAELKTAGAREIYVFGSAAKGTAAADLDLAVSGLPPSVFYRMGARVSDLFGRSVDLIDLDRSTPFTRHLRTENELVRVG